MAIAGLIAGAIVETGGNEHHAPSKPLTPPPTTHSKSRSDHSLSHLSAAALNNQGYFEMRRRHYSAALPLLERAVERLNDTGSLNEAYAEFNLANTRYHLGKCDNVLALLARSEQIQGGRGAIDTLRRDAQRRCR